MREFFLTFIVSLILTPVLMMGVVVAQVMQSPSYQIQGDSINFGGGLSSSTNYTLESTGGEIATGPSESGSYSLRAGYQQMHEVYLAMTGAASVSMTPAIPGVSGGTANGSTTVTVTTDGAAGYELTVAASESPAMQKNGDTIADYVPAGADPDAAFGLDSTDAHFGYTPVGVDVVQRFRLSGTCNADGGSSDADTCWDGLSTSAESIAQGAANHPNGATTTVFFRVGIGGSVTQPPGTYTATTTLTALPL